MKRLLAVLAVLILPLNAFAVEIGRIQQTATTATLTVTAAASPNSGRNCLSTLTVDDNGQATTCTFTVASGGSTLFIINTPASAAASPYTFYWPYDTTTGHAGSLGLCGVRNTSLTVSSSCTAYNINVSGYIDQ